MYTLVMALAQSEKKSILFCGEGDLPIPYTLARMKYDNF